MHHRLGSSSSMSQSFLLTPSHITLWKVMARNKYEEIWNKNGSKGLAISTYPRLLKTSAIYVPTCCHTSMYLYSTFHLCCTCQHSVHLNYLKCCWGIMLQAPYVLGRRDIKSTTAKNQDHSELMLESRSRWTSTANVKTGSGIIIQDGAIMCRCLFSITRTIGPPKWKPSPFMVLSCMHHL